MFLVLFLLNMRQDAQLPFAPDYERLLLKEVFDGSSNNNYYYKPSTTKDQSMTARLLSVFDRNQGDKLLKQKAVPNHKQDQAIQELGEESIVKTVNFISRQNLTRTLDHFSATWWQSKDRFLKRLVPSRIQNVEGAAFGMIAPYVKHDELRMTSDWLKLSVEHMSKAWKLAGIESSEETQSYHMYVEKFLDYVDRTLDTTQQQGITTSSQPSAMAETIAVIAFIPYKTRPIASRGQVLTTGSLAATLMSLIRVECGRVLIVVDRKDFDHASASVMVATKQLLQNRQRQDAVSRRINLESVFNSSSLPSSGIAAALATKDHTNTFEYMIHKTEIGLVVVNCTEDDETKRGKMRMVPKAALLNLKKAFEVTDVLHTQQWLGRTSSGNYNDKWNYTYLTEPDIILHARDEAMPAFTRELQNGKILVPHRLQPIPHAKDLPDYTFAERVLPAKGNFLQVSSLGTNAMCCDDGPSAPGWVPNTVCGSFWWLCGFSNGNKEELEGRDRHFRLEHYRLMELQADTRIVSLAGTEHGRRCVPKLMGTGMGNKDCP